MKTFRQFSEDERVDEGLWTDLKSRLTKKKKQTSVKNGIKRTGHGDQAYRTDHHYGHGDIDPMSIPVFKPSF